MKKPPNVPGIAFLDIPPGPVNSLIVSGDLVAVVCTRHGVVAGILCSRLVQTQPGSREYLSSECLSSIGYQGACYVILTGSADVPEVTRGTDDEDNAARKVESKLATSLNSHRSRDFIITPLKTGNRRYRSFSLGKLVSDDLRISGKIALDLHPRLSIPVSSMGIGDQEKRADPD
ncbi:hypothetical protein KM043_005961 [Ampulex compressa]|nr:hypothetical protein KM043_005961 [Ampulex compressa]